MVVVVVVEVLEVGPLVAVTVHAVYPSSTSTDPVVAVVVVVAAVVVIMGVLAPSPAPCLGVLHPHSL